jgi:hypothetical protein
VRCPRWKWLWALDRRVVLLLVIIGVCVGCMIRENPVVVRCGGLMLRRERHGRGGDVLLRELPLMEPEGRPVVGCPVV